MSLRYFSAKLGKLIKEIKIFVSEIILPKEPSVKS